MPTTPRSQSTLAADKNFQQRLNGLLISEAIVVAAEPTETEHHEKRRLLAQQIMNNPMMMSNPLAMTAVLAPTIVNGTNLVAANTTFNFEAGCTETSASDAEIRSQIATLWNTMAGV